ncbi:MAG TPA: DUF3775 domain-containing protein [Acetobacteraceae bacterium]|nr:DUF3775 domain-containing protein [Acetobacteraceae bacterium]
MLSVPIDRIAMLLEQASQVGSDFEDEPDEIEDEGESEGTQISQDTEDLADHPAYRELTAMLDEFTPGELYQLLALAAIGSGDVSEDAWDTAMARARSVSADEAIPELARILVATDAIENALDRLGYELSDDEPDDDDEDDEDESEEDEDEDEDEEES